MKSLDQLQEVHGGKTILDRLFGKEQDATSVDEAVEE